MDDKSDAERGQLLELVQIQEREIDALKCNKETQAQTEADTTQAHTAETQMMRARGDQGTLCIAVCALACVDVTCIPPILFSRDSCSPSQRWSCVHAAVAVVCAARFFERGAALCMLLWFSAGMETLFDTTCTETRQY